MVKLNDTLTLPSPALRLDNDAHVVKLTDTLTLPSPALRLDNDAHVVKLTDTLTLPSPAISEAGVIPSSALASAISPRARFLPTGPPTTARGALLLFGTKTCR